MAKAQEKTRKISEKEFEKVRALTGRLNEIRQVYAREQAALNDTLDLIGDRYDVNLLDGSYQLTNEGELVKGQGPDEDKPEE